MSAAAAQLLTFNSRSFTNYYAQSTMANIVWQNTTTSWTDAQVLDLYQSDTVPTGVTMYLAMNEGTGTTATDTSGNANNGTLTVPTWTTDTPTKLRTAVAVEPLPLVNAGFETAPPFTAATTGTLKYIDGTASGSATDVGYKWITSTVTNSEVKFDSAVKYTGDYSMKLSTLSSGALVSVAQRKADIGFTVKPNTTYMMSYRIKTQLNSGSSSSGAYGSITRKKSDDTTIGTTFSTSVLTTQDWTTYSFTVTTTPETAYLEPAVSINGSNGAGTLVMDAWFDDIEIKEVIPQRKTLTNLLSNGNFEYAPPFTAATTTTSRWIDGTAGGSGASQAPYTWGLFGASLSTSAQFDTAQTKTGQYSLKLSTLSANRICTVAPQIAVTTQGIPSALPSTTYSYSFWMKTNKTSGDSAGAYIDFLERNGAGNAGTSHLSTQVNTTTDWTYYSGSFTTASTCRFITPKLFVEGNTGTATLIMDAWFDDITLTKTYPVKSTRSLVDNTVIYNGNFEYVPTGTTATTSGGAWIDGTATGATNKGEFGWVIFNYIGSWAAKFDTTEKYSGTASMKISTTAVSSTIGVANQEGIAASSQINNMPIAPSTSYTLSFKMKTLVNSGSATTGAYLSVIGYKVDGFSGASGFTGTTSSTTVNTTTDWTEYSITFTTASTAYYLRPELRIIGNNGTGTLIMDAWFDDLTLVKN
jgi:hypothetical protein